MSKRYFKIDFNGSGGEVVVGTITQEFYDYWADRDQDDLVEHLNGMNDSEGDPDSPVVSEHGNLNAYELDDLIHVNGAYDDNGYWVTEINPHNPDDFDPENGFSLDDFEEVSDGIHYDDSYSVVYSCEAYNNFDPSDEYIDDASLLKPTIAWHSSEKGNFGTVIVEADDDFDPELMAFGVVETSVASVIQAVWYDRKPLTINFDYADTRGKGTYAELGYIYEPWFQSSVSEEDIEEMLNDIYGE